jgi:hypothetical protein
MTDSKMIRLREFAWHGLPSPQALLDTEIIAVQESGARVLMRSNGLAWITSGGGGATVFEELANAATANLPAINAPTAQAFVAVNNATANAMAQAQTKAPLQGGALVSDSGSAPNAAAVVNAIANAVAGTTGLTTTAFSTAIALDLETGREMGLHNQTTDLLFTVAGGYQPWGSCNVTVKTDGTHAIAFDSHLEVKGDAVSAAEANRAYQLAFVYLPDGFYCYVSKGRLVDSAPPTVSTASVESGASSSVRFVMSEPMDAGFVPLASDFTISGHTTTGTPTVLGNIVTVNVTSPFVNGEAARTASYTQGLAGNRLQDLAHNLLANFAGVAITNNVPVVDTSKPTFTARTVGNATPNEVEVTMSEAVLTPLPASSAFAVSGSTISSIAVGSGPTKFILTLSAPLVNGQVKTFSYTKPGANNLRDAAGNETDTASGLSITNNVNALPTVTGVVVESAAPTKIIVTLSEAYTGALPAHTAFAVNTGHAITAIANGGATNKIELTTSTAFVNGEAARTLAYTKPGANPITGATSLQQLASFSGQAITNNVAGAGGTLTATQNTTPGTENLDGYLDWIVLGGGGHQLIDVRKAVAGVAVDLIPTRVSTPYARNFLPGCTLDGSTTGGMGYTWTGDAVTEGGLTDSARVAFASPSGVHVGKLGASGNPGVMGLYWDLPAMLATRRAKVTIAVYANAIAPAYDLVIRAHLSDGSAPDQVIPVPYLVAFEVDAFEVEFTYNAAADGRTMRLSVEHGAGDYVPAFQTPAGGGSVRVHRVTYDS